MSRSVNKINDNNLVFEPQDTHKVFKNIELKTFKTEKWVEFLLNITIFGVGLLLQPD